MTRKALKQQLKTALQAVEAPVRTECVQRIQSLAQEEGRQIPERDRIPFSAFLSMQIRFIGWKIWAAQGGLLAAICGLFAVSMGEHFLDAPRNAGLLLCCLSVLVFMTALPFIHRAFYYKMHEIEAATRFSSVKLLVAKLLVIGIGDVSMLGGILCMAVYSTPLPAQSALLYVLLPFLLASSGFLYLLGHIPATRFALGGILTGLLPMLAFALLAKLYPAFYQQAFSLQWAAVCMTLAAFCGFRLHQIIRRSAYMEMQLIEL